MNGAASRPIPLLVAIVCVLLTGASRPAHSRVMSVSVPALDLAANERIVGFSLHISSGMIVQMPRVPIGWNVYINNDPSWNTCVDGSLIVGAAAVGREYFTNFLTVEQGESSDTPFDMRGEVEVSADFAKSRTIQLGMHDFALLRTGH